jgi:hypothetical protein
MDDDPEQRRVVELLLRQRRGLLEDAEQVELDIYRGEQPELVSAAEAQAEQAALGQGWLARVEADEALRKAERTPGTRIERAAGVVLLGAGWLATIAGWQLGPVMVVGGIVILIASMIRVRVGRGRRDPYDDVKQ